MKVKFIKIIATFSLILIIIWGMLSVFLLTAHAQGSSDINYTINSEIFYTSNQYNYTNDFNLIHNVTSFTETYYGSYSFENESGLVGNNISYVGSETPYDGGTSITDSYDNHTHVLKFTDDVTPGEDPNFYHYISQGTSGRMEFYLQVDNTNEYPLISWREGATTISRIRITGGNLDYTDTSPAWQTLIAFSVNQWYHLRFDWFANNTWDIYVNGFKELSDEPLENPQVVGIDRLLFSHSGDSTMNIYMDAIGEDWLSNYTINDNFFPTTVFNDTLSYVSRYEFAFEGEDDALDIGDNNPEGWTFQEGGGASLQIDVDHSSATDSITTRFYRDRVIEFNAGSSDSGYVERNSLGLTALDFANVTYGFNVSDFVTGSIIRFEVYEADETSITSQLRFYDTAGTYKFGYYKASVIELYSGLSLNSFYHVNSMLDYVNNINHIMLFEDDNLIGFYHVPFASTSGGDNSIGKMIVKLDSGAGASRFELDYIGIYNNGFSEIAEGDTYGFVEIKFYEEWNTNYLNLVTINATGNLLYYDFDPANNMIYVMEGVVTNKLSNWTYHHNTSHFNNVGDRNFTELPHNPLNSSLVIYTKDNITFNYINIEGVSLTQGTNDYYLYTDSGSANINNSYFYSQDNKLYYTCTFDDSNTEFIKGIFQIGDFLDTNYSINHRGYCQGSGVGYVGIEYSDYTNINFAMDNTLFSNSYALAQGKYISNLTITITDNDGISSGSANGYTSTLGFYYFPDLSLSLSTVDFMDAILVLIMLLVPPLLISYVSGKRSVILPMMILMSIICYATSLIELWLLFVLVFSLGGFIFIERRNARQ